MLVTVVRPDDRVAPVSAETYHALVLTHVVARLVKRSSKIGVRKIVGCQLERIV